MPHTHFSASERREHLQHVLDHAAHYLPTQGPIGVFVHHNTLHAFQHQEFEPSVQEAAQLFKAQPFLAEETYQNDRARGRILDQDIDDVLSREPDAEILPGQLTRRQLRRALLIPGVRRVNGIDIAWAIEEGDWLENFRHDLPPAAAHQLTGDTPKELWDVCLARVPKHTPPAPGVPKRPREAVIAEKCIDLDLIVNPPLIRLTGAYLDQGIAYWPMPLREEGLLAASRKIMSQPLSIARKHLTLVGREYRRQMERSMSAEDVVIDALERLAVFPSDWEDFLMSELIALPGWAGMIRMLENDVTLAPHDRVKCSLMEFLALRLTYTLAALEDIMGDTTTWRAVKIMPHTVDPLTPVARFFDAAQLLGLQSSVLARMP
ncbi:MAG: putative inorganic carbon transporter subunit DabA, partial [Prosthecobacter sp.]